MRSNTSSNTTLVSEERFRMELRERLVGQMQRTSVGRNAGSRAPGVSGPLAQFGEICEAIQTSAGGIGSLPPEPGTLRGRAGARLVRLVARALFWYTPRIASFHALVARGFRESLVIMSRREEDINRLREDTAELRKQVLALRAELELRKESARP